eukprot:CAMPEP_0178945478 /NCGR_PEP_ID=MMETSP0789-20121207/3759_1 /TAXON_ID=3005 /ORGANISM="Rhizosolenia setigera, Strain CCMP 1694" /LENGTH=329 /DNA_ID=CAMNT_0020625377 /DNA_START=89 /DNA_END=1078 /DNA_ORIENTATION=-
MICGLSLNHWANSGGTEGHISGTTVMKTKPSVESSSSIRNPSNSYGIESSNESPTEPISYENYLERDFDDFSTAFSDYEDDFLFGEDDDMNNNFARTTSIEAKISEISDRNLIRDVSTPQGKAYDFIVNKDERYLEAEDNLLIQRYVLALLYYSTMGENWNHDGLHFLTGVNECHWYKKFHKSLLGVIDCDSDLHVTKIQLSGTNLNGEIPSEIGQLERLTSLDLGNNLLTGTIPPQLGDLSKLSYLALNSNSLTGKIPTQLGKLTETEEMLFHFNDLSGIVPSSLCDLKLDAGNKLYNFWTDCASSNPPLYCPCCTICCNGLEACDNP